VAAWALRLQYPTAVLRRKSRSTADRAGWLFHLTGLPVLLIADGVLNTTDVSELLSALSNDNVRAVILHVQRVSQGNNDKLGVYDPMEVSEALVFAQSFGHRTGDHERAALLKCVGDPFRHEYERLRSPFFFGLITYEKRFTHLSTYVANHLQQTAYIERKLLGYLSLISTFSQLALSSSLARRIINLQSNNVKAIECAVGADTARLIVEWDKKVKLIHPLIAEEVLAQLGGGQETWRMGLSDLCIDFAREAIQAAGDYTTELQEIFRSMFFERENWNIEEISGNRDPFSPLLMTIPSDAGRARLLETLTDLCPNDPHFWSHRGRLSAYCESPNYREAEEYVLKAIELSGGRDPLHHHALGMVRRFWMKSKVRDIVVQSVAKKTPVTPESLFEQVKDIINGSLEAFAAARKLDSQDPHGYVTAVQTILFLVEELSKTAGHGFNSLCIESGSVGDWVREQVATAEQLLSRLARERGNDERSSYEITCLTKLAKLYGSYELIKSWEDQLDKTSHPEYMRRAIVSLYLAKRQRRWASMEPKELRRVVKLCEENLRSNPTDVRDLRSWFQAMRRLPEFNYYEAIERLQSWVASGGDALEAFYYQYILDYLRWTGEGDDAEDVIAKNIQKCIELRTGQRGFSYEWLSTKPMWCPIVSGPEIGEWDRQRNFFTDVTRLAFAKGTIESIKPQAGTIRLGRVLRAFFVPPADIREVGHLNDDVHFYLGFSYEGFRAWGVKLGPAPILSDNSLIRESKQPKTPLKIWVGGIPFEFKESDMRALFEPFGRVDSVELPPSFTQTGNNRGFGFVTMRSKADAQIAIQRLHGQRSFFGKRLQVREADR